MDRKILEKAKKLQALVERGEMGEALAAKRALDALCLAICGTGSTKYYHLEIDGELRTFLPQNLQLVEKRNNNPKK